MESTSYSAEIKRTLAQIYDTYPVVEHIVRDICQAQGIALLVGGAVRDTILQRPLKDYDIEVHGIPLEKVQRVLEKYGTVDLVGKSFGVLRIRGIAVDWSIPRTDTAGRKPAVTLDPFMTIKDAAVRRDLTMNAMSIDLYTGDLIDPFDGIADIGKKVLRTPDPLFFMEDPLRFFRVMQFIGRFDMIPDAQLQEVCRTMDIHAVSRERIEMEFEKLFLQSRSPSTGLRWIYALGRLKDIMPELYILADVVQDSEWHPEGNVLEHSFQTLDAAALIVQKHSDTEIKLVALWAALCHDLGKAETTTLIEGRWKSHGHAQAGVPLAKKMLTRITGKKDIVSAVCKLIYYHMVPAQFVSYNTRFSRYKRLALKLAPDATLAQLADLVRADQRGRNAKGPEPLSADEGNMGVFVAQAEKAGVLEHAEKAILSGADFLDVALPGPALGMLVKKAYRLQIEQGITDKEKLKRATLEQVDE
ncbi:MAG TPA: HD domain-containing protein [Candidatus Bathyarchaeia archaeon]|nr:HD domain-containing protein [Candidatus Bathyarchaeia archaeon]